VNNIIPDPTMIKNWRTIFPSGKELTINRLYQSSCVVINKLEYREKITPSTFNTIKAKMDTKKTDIPLLKTFAKKTIPKASTTMGSKLTI